MKSVLFRALIVVVIFVIGSTIGYQYIREKKTLKIYSPEDFNPKLVDKSALNNTKEHVIGPFSLIGQLGQTVNKETFQNKIYIANFIFTTCPGICPKMTNNMQVLYKKLKTDPEILFISHTVNPEGDSVPVLLKYATKYQADHNKWFFVTGEKKQLYDLARHQYFATISEGDGGANDFVHTENFILIDKKSRIRGVYDGTSFDEIDRLENDIQILKEEN